MLLHLAFHRPDHLRRDRRSWSSAFAVAAPVQVNPNKNGRRKTWSGGGSAVLNDGPSNGDLASKRPNPSPPAAPIMERPSTYSSSLSSTFLCSCSRSPEVWFYDFIICWRKGDGKGDGKVNCRVENANCRDFIYLAEKAILEAFGVGQYTNLQVIVSFRYHQFVGGCLPPLEGIGDLISIVLKRPIHPIIHPIETPGKQAHVTKTEHKTS